MNKIPLAFIILFTTFPLFSQSPFPFGSAPMSVMEMTEYARDKDAAAVYLFDWCKAKLDVTNDIKMIVQKHFRIKILKQDGVDYASFKIQLGDKSTLSNFKASTFNLEDGKIVESPLNKKDMYTEKSGTSRRTGFAFTNVKVGSIIECSYTVSLNSYFFLYPWTFQHPIPVVYSEYNACYPGLFRYKIDPHFENVKVNTSRNNATLLIGSISTTEHNYKWSTGNVPAFKPEPYMASESDFVSRIQFELAGIDWPNHGYQEATPTYEKLSEKLLEDDNFGGPLNKTAFLSGTIGEITSGMTDNLTKVKAIHRYITQNVKWNEEIGIFTSGTNFRKTVKNQNGSAADINLLFVAMLQKAGITSCPVVLSTRENGSLNPFFAIVTKFDYVVACAIIDGKEYLMDATNDTRPFNELPFECLNGNGRTIHPRMSKWIPLYNNEQQYDQVLINAEIDTTNALVCNVQQLFGSYSAYNTRKMLQTTGKEGFLALLKAGEGNKEYSDLEIQNQDSVAKSLIIKYKVKIKGAVQSTPDLRIINPVLLFTRSENPFSSSERKFPIDLGCPETEIYTLNINIPENYEIDEMPSEINLKLENKGAEFAYIPSVSGNELSLKYRFYRKSSQFPAESYSGLTEFYVQYIKKQSEPIVLKKKSTTITSSL